MDEIAITRAIVDTYYRDFLDNLEMDVAIIGAGPSGLACAYYLAKQGFKTAIYERKLSVGGGMAGGGMMFNRVVYQKEAKPILDEFGITTRKFEKEYLVSDSLEAVSALCYHAIKAGTRIFNLISVEDVMIREGDRVTGLVLNWSAVDIAKLHVDPLTVRCKVAVDATGHDAEVCRKVAKKIGPRLFSRTGDVIGEKPMWAEVGENELVSQTAEVYPGLLAAGMAVNAVFGLPRMGAIFGGMLLSGRRAAELAAEMVKKAK